MIKVNELIHGFRVKYSQPLPEIGATLWRMEYEKNGADLIWLEREDDNKTFAITFKTIPQDSTGVFHILEHSVLCGSDKYPLREPFVELLKSSLSTFLNAFTFPDKTMYPLSSRNDTDFLNLMDVYLDAVLHPLSVKDPNAFLQEGWHYELTEPDGELTINGVVFNEMKGDHTNPDSLLRQELGEVLFPDVTYGFESGGDPDHIPELSYENYLASHARFYHPSNSRIFLDGSVDIDAALEKISGFIGEYERIDPDADIPMQQSVCAKKTAYYEIGPEESEENKALLARAWVYANFDETERNIAFSILTSVLAGSNDAPLKKALLDSGICEDVDFGADDGIQQNYAYLVLRNADEKREDEAWKIVDDTIYKLADEGLDHKRIEGILSRMEFNMRERDFGGMPKGIVYAIQSMDAWLYGGDPAQSFSLDKVFKSLREKVDTGWFESFMRECLISNRHMAQCTMLPSKTVGREKLEKERSRLAALKDSWSDERKNEVIAQLKELRRRQETVDTPEQLATLPVLSLSDIPEKGSYTPQTEKKLCGATVLHHPLETDGITYYDYYFDASHLGSEELGKLSLLSALLGRVATENYTPLQLMGELESKLGRFVCGTTVYTKDGVTTPYFVVNVALLDGSKGDAVRLTDEILNRSLFTDYDYIFNLIRQERMGLEQTIMQSGNRYAAMRAQAAFSAQGAVREAMDGISYLRFLQSIDKNYTELRESLCASLKQMTKELFGASSSTVGYTGAYDEDFASQMLGVLKAGEVQERAEYAAAPIAREGFLIPAEIGYSAKCSRFAEGYTGSDEVASQYLTFEYLWNTVRVKGGAYGTGCRIGMYGDVAMTSFRDPDPARSLETYEGCADSLRALCAEGAIDKYIISAIGGIEPVLTPRTAGVGAVGRYLCGRDEDAQQKNREELLHTTPKALEAIADSIEKALKNSAVCVIGGQNVLDKCALDKIEPLQ